MTFAACIGLAGTIGRALGCPICSRYVSWASPSPAPRGLAASVAAAARPAVGSRGLAANRDYDRLRSWLERFGHAWEARDAERAAALFSAEASYREAPFDEPLRGAREIREHWARLPTAQDDIAFTHEVLAAEPWGIAHWHGSYTRADDGIHVEIDGILLVSLDEEGRCGDFREWSNRRERARDETSSP